MLYVIRYRQHTGIILVLNALCARVTAAGEINKTFSSQLINALLDAATGATCVLEM